MVKVVIDGQQVEVQENTTILETAKSLSIDIPTLCYFKELNEIGACRLCIVEVENEEKLLAACNTIVSDGMVITTSNDRIEKARKVNLELIAKSHNFDCDDCVRNNNCTLQSLCKKYGLKTEKTESVYDSLEFPLCKDESKCINCYRCVSECEKVQSMRVWQLNGTGERTKVEIRDGLAINEVNCVYCGQCATHCPTSALFARDDTQKFLDAINDKEKITVVQVAPAVRSGFSEAVGIPYELSTEKKMAAALKALGVDYVFDTNFSADLTIMEEGTELLEYLGKRQNKLPMFTSCCPGWVRFLKHEFPDMVKQLSTSKSPQQMFGAVAKSYFAEKMGIDKDKIVCISIMPCVAKKYECDVKEVNDASSKDVDMSLTTRELGRLLKDIDVASLEEVEFDSPLGEYSGAAVIFGATGGVMEAALRTVYYVVEGENPPLDVFYDVRAKKMDDIGKATWREMKINLKGSEVKVAIASSLSNARALVEAIKSEKVQYDFVEVMACPGGCAGGGGQPIADGEELAIFRGKRLYELDDNCKIRFSHENPEVNALYKDYLEKPLSERAEELLHTDQTKWTL